METDNQGAGAGLECPQNPILQQDLEAVAAGLASLEAFAGKTIYITGAAGVIGGMATRALLYANRVHGLGVKVLAGVRSEERARQAFGPLLARPDFVPVAGDVTAPLEILGEVDYILHAAATTKSVEMVDHPVETVGGIVDGTRNVLELARRKSARVVYLSSMEVYGSPEAAGNLKEEAPVCLTPLAVRSGYPLGKALAENLCVAYSTEYGTEVVIARLGQCFGAGVPPEGNRVYGQFARSVLCGEDIVLHTQGEAVRSYCYLAEAVEALFLLLAKGEAGQAYNVANEGIECSVRQMAETAAGLYPEKNIRVRVDADGNTGQYNTASRLLLDCEKLRALGWQAKTGMDGMLRRMVESMRFNAKSANCGEP